MTPGNVARRTTVWLIAALLWLYAGLALILGLLLAAFWMPLGLHCILGATLVAGGSLYQRRKRPLLAGALLIAGGVLVGGGIGVAATLFEYDSLGALLAGFLIGVVLLGWPAVLTGVSLIGWSFWHRRRTDVIDTSE